ncbi:lytic transglycosylase domain-containing protein [Saccharospirillum impatiens]|uniref:lytic transglycosylase domain-containing protein n=1 Tax=Saccharospirillum impatiens TaxID=169438 RepID=UPI000419A8CD|nr:lytic transglycosylase domain-containing protein [Saccharospirillum impatiens]
MRNRFSCSLIVGLCLAPWVAVNAQTNDVNAMAYASWLSSIEENAFSFAQLQQQQGHPLYPHLATHWVEHNLEQTDAAWFQGFLTEPEHQPAAWTTRRPWLNELARREAWSPYLNTLAASGETGSNCQPWRAREALGDRVPVAEIRTAWLVGYGLADACSPFLDRLPELDDFNELVWQRQLLAFAARSGNLIGYLNTRYTEPEWQARGDWLVEVYNDPTRIASQLYHPEKAWHRDLALAAVDRMAYLNPENTSNLWVDLIRSTPSFSQAQVRDVSEHLGIAMAKLALPQADYWLTIADPRRQSNEVQHWRLQLALARSDWQGVLDLHQALPDSLKNRDQWQYWSAKALYHTEEKTAARLRFETLSQQRSYYGFLAASQIGRPAALNPANSVRLDDIEDQLSEMPALQRARLLFLAGDIERAQIEWNLAVRPMEPDQHFAAAHLAAEWQWHHKASQTVGWSGRFDELDLRYPTPWNDLVTRVSEQHQVPPYWIYGVIRQESGYMTRAVSSAGAMGLMQLMPYTAQHLSDTDGLGLTVSSDITEPIINLDLGTRYLARMMVRYDNPVYATAAYNAGPSRVDRWKERYPSDLSIWIESIPFDETRGYVKSVLTYAQIYADRDQQDWTLARWLQPEQLADLGSSGH